MPVLGATPAAMVCLQAMETVKLITGIGEPLVGRLLIFDGEKAIKMSILHDLLVMKKVEGKNYK